MVTSMRDWINRVNRVFRGHRHGTSPWDRSPSPATAFSPARAICSISQVSQSRQTGQVAPATVMIGRTTAENLSMGCGAFPWRGHARPGAKAQRHLSRSKKYEAVPDSECVDIHVWIRNIGPECDGAIDACFRSFISGDCRACGAGRTCGACGCDRGASNNCEAGTGDGVYAAY